VSPMARSMMGELSTAGPPLLASVAPYAADHPLRTLPRKAHLRSK
jgi:hypothetical protein